MGSYETGVIRARWPVAAGVVLWGMVGSPWQVQAQVIPDATLPSENSIVTTDGTTSQITGGASRGSSLFHSFEQFSVPLGDTVVFADGDSFANIISRVTGGTPSDLQGTIRAGGSANVFLINPAGIVFGPNAQLDIGGSFLASTGEGLRFDNGFVYGIANPEAPPLLTVSAPIGLRLGNGPGDIRVSGQGGLAVTEGQSLSLIGGNVTLTGAQLMAPGGRLEIGAVREASELSLIPDGSGFELGFGGVNGFGDIQLSNRSVLNASGPAGGAIDLRGRSVTLTNQSALISDTLGDQDGRGVHVVADQFRLLGSSYIGAATSGSGAGSSVEVTATDIEIVGTAIPNYKFLELNSFLGTRQIAERQIGGIAATTVASGRTGDIALNAQRILLDEGVMVSTESLGTGDSGAIVIDATESLRVRGSGILAGSRVTGVPLLTPNAIATGLSTRGIPAGGGGSIDITTTRLDVEDGSSIVTGTLSDRDSGNVSITATESVTLRGPFAPFVFPTSITTVSIGGDGAAGNLDIQTGRLSVQDGAIIFADSGVRTLVGNIEFGGLAGDVTITATESVEVVGGVPIAAIFGSSAIRSRTFTDAPAGTVQITAPLLRVLDGGRVTSETLNDGPGGAINIDAHTVLVSGSGNEDLDSTSAILASSGLEARVAFITGAIEPVPASGPGGTITINATNLIVQDTGEISVRSFDTGPAGNLEINAATVRLDRNGSLSATTTVDGGGNISLSANTLALDSSRITASSESGDGGNLTFTLRDLLLLRNGSLISTEAGTAGAGGDGGNISLNLPTGFIVAVPIENSDIRANAFEGDGGSVTITARSLLGIEFRPNVLDTPLSDITASSRFGNSGTVTIDQLSPVIAQDDIALPTETAPTALAQGCRGPGAQVGSFVVTGRGGLPTNPADPLSADTVWQDLAPIPLTEDETASSPAASAPEPRATTPIVEAQSWTRAEDGTVMLLADATAAPDHFVSRVNCAGE
ncbi:S-layer family protein [Nodosilinea sp. P-1105]|uniref:two-partner secretion domain-containing protein n=1 Tax=Nodosilinea sp. P-1105 TaxID=2546229 RepID=UPI00146E51F9|nr:S-layer family protein [Nodosilinea sp. P-1105]